MLTPEIVAAVEELQRLATLEKAQLADRDAKFARLVELKNDPTALPDDASRAGFDWEEAGKAVLLTEYLFAEATRKLFRMIKEKA